MHVVVIGAGVAGLAAAQALSAAEVNVLVLEARDRIGGRIYTIHDPRFDLPVELGAEFVHGRPPEIFSIVGAAGLSTPEVVGSHRYARGGRLIERRDMFAAVDHILTRMSDPALPDQPFSQFLATIDAPADAKIAAGAYVEGFNAARADMISVRALAEEMQAADVIEGDRSFRVAAGYNHLAEWLWRECKSPFFTLRLKTVVTRVRWKRGRVEVAAQTVSSSSGELFVADFAVITLPLGVLQSRADVCGAVEFVPELKRLDKALSRLAMGQAMRITLIFRDSFRQLHPGLSRPGFIHSDEKYFPTWWTTLSNAVPALTGWAGGPKAESLVELSDAEVANGAIESLCRILGVATEKIEKQIESYFLHNWWKDPFARGGYSYARVGGQQARRVLAAPIEDTLFFAGEAADIGGHGGTVHGAISTGNRAAQAIIEKR
jgi:monoamine oxidase